MGFFDPGMSVIAGKLAGTPNVPAWNPVTLGDAQTKAISSNQAALPSLEQLASGVNSFNQEQLTSMFNKVMPGFSANSDQIQKNISSELSGKIPTDVAQALQSSDAAKALTGGFGGSGLAGNMTAKDLGLTSLSLMQEGQSAEQSWTSMIDKMFMPGEFNVSSMFIDPQQQFQDTMSNQEQSWNRDWMNNQNKWSGSAGKLWGDELNADSKQGNEMMSSVVSEGAGAAMGGSGGL